MHLIKRSDRDQLNVLQERNKKEIVCIEPDSSAFFEFYEICFSMFLRSQRMYMVAFEVNYCVYLFSFRWLGHKISSAKCLKRMKF